MKHPDPVPVSSDCIKLFDLTLIKKLIIRLKPYLITLLDKTDITQHTVIKKETHAVPDHRAGFPLGSSYMHLIPLDTFVNDVMEMQV